MNSPVNQIKERLTIEEVVSSYIPLVKVGNTLKAKCPFHNEKTPSFFVSNERKSYYCFGCSKGGDIFSFVEEFEGLDFKGALKLLAEKANINLNDFQVENTDEKDNLFKVMEEATRFFEKNLSLNPEALKYLKSRGLEENTISEFRLGFAKDEWRDLVTYLVGKGFSHEIILRAGLIKKKDENEKNYDRTYDRFRFRIMFPIMDSSSRVIAFSGRYLGPDKGEMTPAKYLNSPETPIFSKSEVLYGLHKAKDSIRKNNFSILVEGQMDLLLSHQIGFKNTVATSGTAMTGEVLTKDKNVSNLGLVRRLSPNIIIAFDGDKAGLSATERASKIALNLGMDVKITKLQEGIDPADFIKEYDKEEWKKVIKNSKHIIEFILNNILDEFKSDPRKIGKLIREKVLPYVLLLQSGIDMNFFLRLISEKSGISIDALTQDLDTLSLEQKNNFKNNETVNPFIPSKEENLEDRERKILNYLIGMIFWQKEKDEHNNELIKIIKYLETILNQDLYTFLLNNKINKEELVFKTEEFYSNKEEGFVWGDLTDMLKELKILSLSKKAKDMENDLNNIDVFKEFNLIKIQIEDIKNGRFNFE